MRYSKRRNYVGTNNNSPITNSTLSSANNTWQPKFYAQTANNDFSKSIWSLDNVYPLVYVNASDVTNFVAPGYPTRTNNITGCAQCCADWIDYKTSGILREHGRTITDYSFQLQGFGCAGGNYPNLLNNAADGNRGPWVATGIIQCAAWTYDFVQLFKNELTNRNLPYPTRLDMDIECTIDMSGILELVADPRSTGRLIDGRETLEYYWLYNNNSDPLGQKIIETPEAVYDWAYFWWARNIWHLVGDYAAYESCYKFFTSGFPGITTANFDYFCGTLTNQGFRDKDFHSSHYLVSGLYATEQLIVNYAVNFIDPDEQNWTSLLYGTFDNCLLYYDVPNTGNIIDVVNNLYVKKTAFQANSCYLANPNQPVAVYHWHQPTGIFFAADTVAPNGAALPINQDVLLNQLRQYGLSHVDTILIFDYNSWENNSDEDWHYAISNLSGFHDKQSNPNIYTPTAFIYSEVDEDIPQ